MLLSLWMAANTSCSLWSVYSREYSVHIQLQWTNQLAQNLPPCQRFGKVWTNINIYCLLIFVCMARCGSLSKTFSLSVPFGTIGFCFFFFLGREMGEYAEQNGSFVCSSWLIYNYHHFECGQAVAVAAGKWSGLLCFGMARDKFASRSVGRPFAGSLLLAWIVPQTIWQLNASAMSNVCWVPFPSWLRLERERMKCLPLFIHSFTRPFLTLSRTFGIVLNFLVLFFNSSFPFHLAWSLYGQCTESAFKNLQIKHFISNCFWFPFFLFHLFLFGFQIQFKL